MLYNEILSQKADIICMQEVDRLEKLLPVLEGAGYSHAFAAGPKKRHGCLIAYDKAKYTKVEERTVFYDEQEIRSDGDDRARHGSSFRTKNIGFIAALKQTDAQRGIIVATTHLFWHPRCVVPMDSLQLASHTSVIDTLMNERGVLLNSKNAFNMHH